MPGWNFGSNILGSLPRDARGLVALGPDGSRDEWTFGEIDELSCRFAGALSDLGVSKGDVVATVMGNSADWVFTLTACWRMGAIAMPCNVQLTPHDLRKRIDTVGPKVIVAADEHRSVVEGAGFEGALVSSQTLRDSPEAF